MRASLLAIAVYPLMAKVAVLTPSRAGSHKVLSVLLYSHRGVVKNEAISERASAEPK